jgi:hypothetical protein
MIDLTAMVASARLEGIDVIRCHWDRVVGELLGPVTYPAQLKQSIDIGVRHPDAMPAGGAVFLVQMLVRWESDEDIPVAAAEVHLRMAYALAEPAQALTAKEAGAFGQKVALHQAWPFLRHRLQLLCMELGINPVLLPLKPLQMIGSDAVRGDVPTK